MPKKTSVSAGEQREIISARLVDLKPHPLQEQMFPEADLDIDSLVASIEELGLLDPIKILADMTIVCGHRRVEAFRRLGRAKIPAIMLDGLTEVEVDRLVVSDNFHRRQLSPLARARCAAKLFELSTEKGRTKRLETVAKLLTLCPKEVDRYLAVLDAPPEVQQALERKHKGVSVVAAGAIARMPDDLKEEAVAAIRDGKPVKPIIQRAKSARPGGSTLGERRYRKVFGKLDPIFSQLAEFASGCFSIERPSPHRLAKLEEFVATINKLLALETSQVTAGNTSEVAPPTDIIRTRPSRVPPGHDVPRAPSASK